MSANLTGVVDAGRSVRPWQRTAVRWLFLTHRYLGIAVSALMVIWCLSGIVMMYVSFPRLDEPARLAALRPLALAGCCRAEGGPSAPGAADVDQLDVQMLAGQPVARITRPDGDRVVVDLLRGRELSRLAPSTAAAVAADFGRTRGLSGTPAASIIDNDQWITSEHFEGRRPFYRFAWGDPDGTVLYVSAITGEAMQATTRTQRLWNWVGAVPHWIYFSRLRYHEEVWSQIIIWTSLVGCFLTLTGLYIGVRQFLRRPSQRWTPYRGFMVLHHIPGLVFGLFTLTWVASGLFSMTPWGFLEGQGSRPEQDAVRGAPIDWASYRASLATLSQASGLQDVVALQGAPLAGRIYYVAWRADGSSFRLDANGSPAPLSAAERAQEFRVLAGSPRPDAELLQQEDAFYFSHHSEPVTLPVYRVTRADAGRIRYYLDPVSGEIIRKVDGSDRGYRWLHQGLHRLDFTPTMRARPVWDVLMLVLMAGVTMICVSGLYFATLRATGRRRGLRA